MKKQNLSKGFFNRIKHGAITDLQSVLGLHIERTPQDSEMEKTQEEFDAFVKAMASRYLGKYHECLGAIEELAKFCRHVEHVWGVLDRKLSEYELYNEVADLCADLHMALGDLGLKIPGYSLFDPGSQDDNGDDEVEDTELENHGFQEPKAKISQVSFKSIDIENLYHGINFISLDRCINMNKMSVPVPVSHHSGDAKIQFNQFNQYGCFNFYEENAKLKSGNKFKLYDDFGMYKGEVVLYQAIGHPQKGSRVKHKHGLKQKWWVKKEYRSPSDPDVSAHTIYSEDYIHTRFYD